MPELRYMQSGIYQSIHIPWMLDHETVIASGAESVTGELITKGVVLQHATIIKFPESPAYVLLDHASPSAITEVNGLPVLKFKVIRHGDCLILGRQQFSFSEFELDVIENDSSMLQEECPVIMPHPFGPGDQVVICRCGQPYHLTCWLIAERCARHDCAYSHRNLLVKFLQDRFVFETLAVSSPLVDRFCSNPSDKYPWDQEPFAKGDRVAYCPQCKIPYHETCWLSFEMCPTPDCGYNVRDYVLAFFSSPEPMDRGPSGD